VRLLITVSAAQGADCHTWAFVTVSLFPSQKAPLASQILHFQPVSYFYRRSYPTCTSRLPVSFSYSHSFIYLFQLHLEDCVLCHYASCIYTPFACL